MAAITHSSGILSSTSNATSYASAAFTPATDDLLVVFVQADGTVDAGSLTSSVGGATFTRVDVALYATSANSLYCFVADQLATNVSQTVTFDCPGDIASGCEITVERISGITKTGLTAILQSKKQENQAATGTPAPTFDSAVQTANPTLGAVGKQVNSAMTEPTGWTELYDDGHSTPNNRLEVVGRASGFTGTTVTWGSASDGAFASIIVEIDASSAGSVTGTGALQAGAGAASGSGASSSTGGGTATAQGATLSGAGSSSSMGLGAVLAQGATASGAGITGSTGTGALQAGAAQVAGSEGAGTITGTGTLQAGGGASSGAGISASSGAGVLAANDNQIAGSGVSSSIGAGALGSGAATIAGHESIASVPGKVVLGAALRGRVALAARLLGKVEVA